MKENWEKAIKFVLDHEGGYSFYSNDPGGETNYGISKRAYPNLDIANMTEHLAKSIYKSDYWDECKCDDLEWPIDLIVFDAAVNCGISNSLSFRDDGHTWEGALLQRVLHYVKLAQKEKFKPFLRGWLNRTMDLYRGIYYDTL